MFCPGCGSEQHGQYCRSCGIDLRMVRTALEKPDAAVASSISARDEIGRAIADKIREMKSAKELSKVVEEVLPGVAEFLETPEESRLRRIRGGMIMASIGLGAALAFATLAMAIKEEAVLFVAGLGLSVFLIGLGLVFNGWLFTVPKKRGKDKISDPLIHTTIESLPNPAPKATSVERIFPASISEHTTHHLPDTNTGEK
jgi:hypothetical protein